MMSDDQFAYASREKDTGFGSRFEKVYRTSGSARRFQLSCQKSKAALLRRSVGVSKMMVTRLWHLGHARRPEYCRASS